MGLCLHGFSGRCGLKLGILEAKQGNGWYAIDLKEFVLTFVGYYFFPNLVKIDQEMRPLECGNTDRHRHNGFMICPMLYATHVTMGQKTIMGCIMTEG